MRVSMGDLNLENQLDEKTKELILKMEDELEAKDNEIKSKDKEIAKLQNELAYLKHQIHNKNRKIFGTSSEQASTMQISFFDEAENNSNLKIDEPTIEQITYKRNKPS